MIIFPIHSQLVCDSLSHALCIFIVEILKLKFLQGGWTEESATLPSYWHLSSLPCFKMSLELPGLILPHATVTILWEKKIFTIISWKGILRNSLMPHPSSGHKVVSFRLWQNTYILQSTLIITCPKIEVHVQKENKQPPNVTALHMLLNYIVVTDEYSQ